MFMLLQSIGFRHSPLRAKPQKTRDARIVPAPPPPGPRSSRPPGRAGAAGRGGVAGLARAAGEWESARRAAAARVERHDRGALESAGAGAGSLLAGRGWTARFSDHR